MSTSEPIPGGSECLIKFASRADYNHFVAQLRAQLRSYLVASCHENKVEIGSPDFLALEAVLMDVFMKYTLEFLRENLLVGGRPVTPPAELSGDGSGAVNGTGGRSEQQAAGGRSKGLAKTGQTRPCDTALNERVIRQQYALCEAAIENTRKRKDLPGHIQQRVLAAADQASDHVRTHTRLVDHRETIRAQQLAADPRQRWDLLNAEPPDIQATQDDFTSANQTIGKLIHSLPQLIESASRAIDLHQEVASSLKTV